MVGKFDSFWTLRDDADRPFANDDARRLGRRHVEYCKDVKIVRRAATHTFGRTGEPRSHLQLSPSGFGGKELGQAPCYRIGIVFHWNVTG